VTARDVVLGRIRDALGPDPLVPDVPRAYRAAGEHPPGSAALVEVLVDRLEDYRAAVVRAGGDDASIGSAIRQAISEALGHKGARDRSTADDHRDVPDGILAAPGTPPSWVDGIRARSDDGTLAPAQLDAVPAVVSGSVVAIAETGTIVLDGSPLCGRRALTLVPDVHICVVRAGDVVQTVPEALARLDPTRPLTFVSGPSATSDIELNRVEGVHGPRTLVVVLAG